MTVTKIPQETIKQCDENEECVVNYTESDTERNHQKKICFLYCQAISIVLFMASLGFLGCGFNQITSKFNFEIKSDTQLFEYDISHADAEGKMQLSSLLDDNSTQSVEIQHFSELNTTIKFVDYINVACKPYLVPEVRVIHDFHGNITIIINDKKQRCIFIMPIMRTRLSPPVSLSDLKNKITSHYYATELKIGVHFDYLRFAKLSVDDLSTYGKYIPETCADYVTFKMKETTEPTTEKYPIG